MPAIIATHMAPKPVGPYSQATEANGLVFVSGQLGIDPATSALVSGGAIHEARRALENIMAILAEAGLGCEDVVRTTIYVKDLAAFQDVNRAYASFFATTPPARSTVGVSALPMGALVEIEAIAARRSA